jgi:hypothetical protein
MANWKNWYGNISCRPRAIERPASEEALAEAVVEAAGRGESVRVAESQLTATMGAGTVIAEIRGVLWEHGLGLVNQGNIDAQCLEAVFPRLDDFRSLRSRLDPAGGFDNEWLQPIVGRLEP